MKTCAHCEQPFQAQRAEAKYCGPTCRNRAYNRRRSQDGRLHALNAATADKRRAWREANPKAHYVERTCVVCGTTWKTGRRDAKYCTQGCYGDAQRRRITGKQLVIPLPRKPGLRQLFEQGRYAEAMASILERTERTSAGCLVIKGKANVPYPTVNWRSNPRQQKRPAHRLILWAKTAGPIDGWQAHHLCANASCVNPDHIVPATAAQNTAEMLARRTYEAEIEALRAALADADPGHPLLRRSLPA